MIGTVVGGRYRVEAKLGEGGMGEVWQARDEREDRIVAVKTLAWDLLGANEVYQKRFQREFEACARLDHPNVIRLYDFGPLDTEDGGFYYAMEYLPFPTLAERIEEGAPLDPAFTLKVLTQIVEALGDIHDEGVVHRDLKPSNVIVTDEGRAVLLDFGLVWDESVTRMTATGEILGTPRYSSPELLRAEAIDGRSDIFQLGILAYEMLAGVRPFDGDTVPAIVFQITSADYASLRSHVPALPRSWEIFVDRCLPKAPEERYQTAEAAAIDLCKIAEGKALHGEKGRRRGRHLSRAFPSLSSTSVAVKVPTKDEGRSKRLAALGGAMAALMALIALIVWVARRGDAVRRDAIFSAPRLEEVDRLLVRYEGNPTGMCEVSIHEERKQVRRIPVDLAKGKKLSQRFYGLRLPLDPPLVGKAEIRFRAGGRDSQAFVVDPVSFVERILEPVDRLRGRRLKVLQVKVLDVRKSIDGQWRRFDVAARRAKARLALEAAFNDAGLGKVRMKRLVAILPHLLGEDTLPGSALARRLLPLRYVEVALRTWRGIEPPWGSIARDLRIEARGSVDPSWPGGWREIGRAKLSTRVNGKTKWAWWSTEEYIRSNRRSFFAGGYIFEPAIKALLDRIKAHHPAREVMPGLSDLAASRSFTIEIGGLRTGGVLRPKRAFMDIFVRLLGSEFAVTIHVNGKRAFTALGTSYIGKLMSNPLSSLHPQWLSIPFDPVLLRPGKNELHVQVEFCPGNEAAHAFSLHELRIRVR